jgi:hypothetical protein
MKKLFYLLIVTIILCGMFSISAAAEETTPNIVETPELKIIISGQESDYTDTPLIIDSRTMLPLREVLTNLGVQNDDEHIIWDGDTKTVTVITEDKTVILQVGSEKAYVNGEEVILDVVPVLYDKNWRTYIPARFVSEALDRKVVWDGGNRAVMISDEETYNEVFEILTKCEKAMADITKLKFTIDTDILSKTTTEEGTASMDFAGEMDIDNDKIHLNAEMSVIATGENAFPILLSFEYYEVDDMTYTNANLFGMETGWSKTLAEEDVVFVKEDATNSFKANEIVACGLDIKEGGDEDLIILEGNALFDELINQSLIGSMTNTDEANNIDIGSYYIELAIDKDTYEVVYFEFNLKAESMDSSGSIVSMNMDMSMTYSDLNVNFDIEVPQDVLDAAVESVDVIEIDQ